MRPSSELKIILIFHEKKQKKLPNRIQIFARQFVFPQNNLFGVVEALFKQGLKNTIKNNLGRIIYF